MTRAGGASQPAVTVSQPAVTNSQPAATVSQRAVTASQPAVTVSQPVVTVSAGTTYRWHIWLPAVCNLFISAVTAASLRHRTERTGRLLGAAPAAAVRAYRPVSALVHESRGRFSGHRQSAGKRSDLNPPSPGCTLENRRRTREITCPGAAERGQHAAHSDTAARGAKRSTRREVSSRLLRSTRKPSPADSRCRSAATRVGSDNTGEAGGW